MSTYTDRLRSTRTKYPFNRWQASGLDQYTPEACAGFTQVFDGLLEDLIEAGPAASDERKLAAIQKAVEALNALNEQDDLLIETGEREDLCELVNLVAVAAGLDPTKYGDGEGPASEWRDW